MDIDKKERDKQIRKERREYKKWLAAEELVAAEKERINPTPILYLSINKGVNGGMMVAIEDETGCGTRLTPEKCWGGSQVIQKFGISVSFAEQMISSIKEEMACHKRKQVRWEKKNSVISSK